MVAVAETWCWIYIVPKYMFTEKKGQRRHQNYGIIKDKKKDKYRAKNVPVIPIK